MKDSSFYEKETDPKFALFVQRWPHVSHRRWLKSEKINSGGEKLQLLGYSNISKSRLYSFPLSRKNMITSCNIFPIFARKQIRVTDQRVRIKIWQNFVNLLKIFGSNIFQFSSYRSQRTFLKNFNWIFKFGCFSGTTPTWKKWVRLLDSGFNAEAIGTNSRSQKWKSKKFVCPFLVTLFHFETNLIK